ncbi:VCBS domain-containing protein [Bradyrhizobium centrosematis]|uniref:VCBS domain-containing protein n=1 Tax=Bradyrhizobium centrosematis TaxID=1300039 RepID=UPI002167314A|nr:VCBS domain-containing protein [Bradyrhizobium centrosematis]MCS3758313.1 VCBS repeat-containing protein [Bradyrhizobium centrosematis]MCS3773798.1 VCBS repeat-containing protein [Bradyrhizobium centrosematis]
MLVASGIQVDNGPVTALPAELIGHIPTVIGRCTLTRASGIATQAVAGAPIYRGDVLETDADGQITIRFIDGTFFSIGCGTRVELSEFVFDVEGMPLTALFDVTRGSFSFVPGRLAQAGALQLNTPIAGIRARGHAGGFGMLTLAALTFSAAQDAEAADPDVTFLDDDSITYKDLAHGAFELVTKERIPRHIIVEDPGETIVIKKVGSTISVNQVTNTSARMDELRAAQQDVLANLTGGQGPHGSSTPPFVKSLSLQPINFIPSDAPTPQNLLAPVTPFAIPVFDPVPPTLSTGAGPTELDTVVFDTFTPTSGVFAASSTSSGAKLTFGVIGAAAGETILDGVTYDLSKPSPYGTLYVNSASGAYTFVPDSTAINALKAPSTDDFVITVSDGLNSASKTFTIIINGVNDAAIISGNTIGSTIEAGGTDNGAPGTPIATGTLSDTDVDDPPNSFTAVSSPTTSTGGYGTFTMTASGVWTYALDNANPAVQRLNAGDTLTDNFTVTTSGGTAQVVTITILGASDAAIVSGATTGAVIEAGGLANANPGTPTATGILTDTDVDTTANAFTAVASPTASAAGYGTFTMTAAGVWTYELDNVNAAVQALNTGETLTDTFTVTTLDGTAQVVTVTIHGTNDAAIVSGTTTGSVTEAGGIANATPGSPSATGTLSAADVDNAPNTFTAVSSPRASTNGYGTFTLTAAGVWTYTLDNASGAVQALNAGGTLTDSFTVTTLDGTPQVVTITIQGSNDAALISGTTTGSVIEAGTFSPGAPIATGTLTDTDIDNPPNTFTAVSSTASDGGYGTFTMTAVGVWTYTLDNNNSVVQALDVGDTLTDTFTVTAIDGTTQTVTVAIHGASDADPNDFDNLATGSAVISDPPNVYGTPGSETIAGGGDTGQIIYAGASSDTVNGTGKADVLYGGSGDDTIKGNDGDDVIYGGSGSDTINGNNGNDVITGGFGADQLTGSNGNDRFAYLFVADSNANQYDTITDFASGADKIDLTAFGALGFVILALSSTSTVVPAHTIAWLYDSAANQTIVYVNPTDQTLHVGDSGLLEIHLQGVATIDASDFITAPAAAPVMAVAGDLLDLTATAQNDATAVMTTTSEVSSDVGGGDGTLLAAGSSAIQPTEPASSLDSSWDQIAAREYPSLPGSDEVQTLVIETPRSDAAPAPAGALAVIMQHMVTHTETSFVFDNLTGFEAASMVGKSGTIAASDQLPDIPIAMLNFAHDAAEHHAGGRFAPGSDADDGTLPPGRAAKAAHAHDQTGDETADTTLNPSLLKSATGGVNHLPTGEAEQHNPSQGASGSHPAGPQLLGDSFEFKGDASPGSLHSAVLARLSDIVGQHEQDEGFHASELASMPETSGVESPHGAGTVHGHVLHDLIV